jgi:glutathione S-transferase
MVEIHGKKDCPFAWRVRLTARQKGIDFDWLPYDVPDPDPRTAEHNPERKSPLIWEDSFALAESVVVAQYLDESRDVPRLMPANTKERARARLLLATLVPKLEVAPSHAEGRREAAIEKVRKGHAALDQVLSDGRVYLGGDSVSLPDLMLWPFLALQDRDGVSPQPARAAEYWRRVKDSPALVATRP